MLRRVVHFPCDLKNPYNRLVVQALTQCGIEATMLAPTSHANPWRNLSWAARERLVHWHWLSRYYQGRSAIRFVGRGLVFAANLAFLKWHRTKMVMTVHNLIPHDSPHPALNRLMNRVCGKLMDRLLVHSPDVTDLVGAAYGARQKVRHVEHVDYASAVPPRVPRDEARRELGLDPRRKVALAFGTIRPYKRLDRLIAAASALDAANTDIIICGTPSSTGFGEHIRGLASGHPNVRVELGFVPDEVLSVYLSAADAAVFTYAESLSSGAAHMGLAYGLPVVCPRTPAFHELIRIGVAFPLDGEGSEAIRSAIGAALARDPARFSAAVHGYLARCSPMAVAGKLRKIYEEVCGEHMR